MPRVNHEEFYGSALAAHGETPEGVQWTSAATQEIRFFVLLNCLPQDLSAFTLVDAGCGLGDLYLYLLKKQKLPGRYIGIDALTPMVEAARRRTGCEIQQLDILRDVLPPADYYLCSGAMNNLTRAETSQFMQNCLSASKYGFLFNLLKGWNTSKVYNLYLPREIHRLGHEFGVITKIHEGYLPGDFTAEFIKIK